MLAWFSIAPDDGSGSYSRHVAAAVEVLEESGLPYRLGAMGTEVEGPREAVFAVLARCQAALAARPGVRRIATVIKIDDRIGVDGGELERKVDAVLRLRAPDTEPTRGGPFDPHGFADDPLQQFRRWMADAVRAGAREPTAMALASAGADGMPDVRMVLLNAVDDRGFTFFTNLESAKAAHLADTPHAALAFWWYETWRQVRVRGRVEGLDDAAAAAYFATRPREAQVGAWASRQSHLLVSREALEGEVRRVEERFDGVEVPKPPHWGGYRVIPDEVEFWQGRSGRLHDRLLYRSDGGGWVRSRLYP